MKIKNIFIPAIAALLLIITSCATTNPHEKKLVGTWYPVSVEKYIVPGSTAQAAAAPAGSHSQKGDSAKMNKTGAPQGTAQAETGGRGSDAIDHAIQAEMRTHMRVTIIKGKKEQRIFEKFFPDQTIKGTWKMSKDGTKVVAKDMHSDRKMTMNILSINDTAATVVEERPYGDIKIKLHKGKAESK
jgi:hypothetical protein